MSCPCRTLVTKSEVTREGTSGASPPAGLPEVSTAAASPHSLARTSGLSSQMSPCHPLLPMGFSILHGSSLHLPLEISYSHLHSYRCLLIPRHILRRLHQPWHPEGVLIPTFTCRSTHATPDCVVARDAHLFGSCSNFPASTEAVPVSSVCESQFVCVCHYRRLSPARVCLGPSVIWVSAPPVRVFGSCPSVWQCLSQCIWAPGSRLGGRDVEGRWRPGERAGPGAETGRGRAGAPRGPRGVCGGPEAAAVAVGSACAGEERPPAAPGAPRPSSAASGESSAPPGTLPGRRPLGATGIACSRSDVGPQKGRPARPSPPRTPP
ncbi:uncharacterized protein LOC134472509 [Cavia porcellus]|uniref:uncharacterized protein LOC134472509 n=1 Tax=Cavia porcellus TaxID=10141 RepID=UPI002FE027AF